MKLSRRLVIFCFILSAILFVGMLFGPFILNEIIAPVSVVVWLLLRLLVLSIDQKYYWGGIIFVVVFFLVRFLPQGQSELLSDESPDSNAVMKTIGYWRNLFILTDQHVQDEKTLKRELIRLLLSFYATKQQTTANFWLYEALERGEIFLPEQIRPFLFPEEPQATNRSLKKRLQSLRNAPQKWIRRITGQETAEHYRMINEVLSFMETALEMKNDDGKFNLNQH
jgi:hypothetical protein